MTPSQLAIIPQDLRERFAYLCKKGMRPAKVAGKLGLVLSQHESQLLSASATDVQWASTREQIAAVYSNTEIGESCMTGCSDSPAYIYSAIGASVAYNNGARTVVNPRRKLFGRIYGNRSSDLYYALLALGYTESDAPLSGMVGFLEYRTVTESVTFSVADTTKKGEVFSGILSLKEYEAFTYKGKEYISGSNYTFEWKGEKCRFAYPVKKITQKRQKLEVLLPAKFYLDGNHVVSRQGNKIMINNGGSPHFVICGGKEDTMRVIPEYTVFRKNERKTVADIAVDYERRINKWKH